MPRLRPPFPAVSGLWQRPTNINNVETLACVPWIITNGAPAFAARGFQKSKGTKVFALTGKVKRSGLAEVPMGLTLRDVIYKIGGGIKNDKPFKAVQMGGPSGGACPKSCSTPRWTTRSSTRPVPSWARGAWWCSTATTASSIRPSSS